MKPLNLVHNCVKNVAFYRDDVICKKCGKVVGFRYKDSEDNKVFLFGKNKCLNPYEEIQELFKQSNSMRLDMEDVKKEILSVAKEPFKFEDLDEEIEN